MGKPKKSVEEILATCPATTVADDLPMREFVMTLAQEMEEKGSGGATLVCRLPTPRGELIVQLRVEIVQPLPRLN